MSKDVEDISPERRLRPWATAALNLTSLWARAGLSLVMRLLTFLFSGEGRFLIVTAAVASGILFLGVAVPVFVLGGAPTLAQGPTPVLAHAVSVIFAASLLALVLPPVYRAWVAEVERIEREQK